MTGRRFEMPLAEFLATVKDGDEHGWDTEARYLRSAHATRLARLREEIREQGILEPIEIGSDARCWDGHHRVVCAIDLQLPAIPVNDRRAQRADAPTVRAATPKGV